MSVIGEVLSYINPLFIYYALAYYVSKYIETIFQTQSFWQWSWNKFMDVFGESHEIYLVWILNSFSYIVYWSFGSALMLMEHFRKPRSIADYKIQQNEQNTAQSQTNLFKVRQEQEKSEEYFCRSFMIFNLVALPGGFVEPGNYLCARISRTASWKFNQI
jgi:hypothetical protein